MYMVTLEERFGVIELCVLSCGTSFRSKKLEDVTTDVVLCKKLSKLDDSTFFIVLRFVG